MSPKEVAAVIPAYNEERLIQDTIRGLPKTVAEIIVVDDCSNDETSAQARAVNDPRVQVIRHESNRGVGAAIYTGYQRALEGNCGAFVVLAGDNQMDHADLPQLVEPIFQGDAEYVKGNRLLHEKASDMPRLRRWGSQALARLTSFACSRQIGDSQCGYTAISRQAASQLDYSVLWPSYGYPNDLLIKLTALGARILERPVRPVYATEQSGLRPWHMISIMRVIARSYWTERRTPSNRTLLSAASQLNP